jgi:hypothetical protein
LESISDASSELVWGTLPLLVAGEEKKRVLPCFYAQAM